MIVVNSFATKFIIVSHLELVQRYNDAPEYKI